VTSSREWNGSELTEPEITLAMAELLSEHDQEMSLFLSNSMPVRDAEFFLYPFSNHHQISGHQLYGPKATGTNRGASGIDGIISSALGFSEATEAPTTLIIGDLSALHDLNSLHSLSNDAQSSTHGPNKKRHGLTTVVVNNNGGGIFSFLPVAKHGNDVGFEEFFGTPTESFSFAQGAQAFGVPFRSARSYLEFRQEYQEALQSSSGHKIVEAHVVGRTTNVAVHRRITESVESLVTGLLKNSFVSDYAERLPVKMYQRSSSDSVQTRKTLVLLHGWMGDKLEWDTVGPLLARDLGANWDVLSVDLPGHGASFRRTASDLASVRSALSLDSHAQEKVFTIESMARNVLRSLAEDYGLKRIDAIGGYSLGGRVMLEMKRQCKTSVSKTTSDCLCNIQDPKT